MTPQWKRLLDHVQAVREGVYETWESGEGWNNDTEFGRRFGENSVPWCVIFDWCMYDDVGLAAIVPKVDNVGVFSSWAKQRGQWSEYPSAGAWVNFSGGAHTEIVVGFDADTVYTKGGNSVQAGSTDAGQGNGVWSHATPRRSTRVVGYFAPRFPDGVCPPTADPNDPRGGRAQTSYTWPGPDPAASAPTTPEEDPLMAFTEADLRRFIREEVMSQEVRDRTAFATWWWFVQALDGVDLPQTGNWWDALYSQLRESLSKLPEPAIAQLRQALADTAVSVDVNVHQPTTTKGA